MYLRILLKNPTSKKYTRHIRSLGTWNIIEIFSKMYYSLNNSSLYGGTKEAHKILIIFYLILCKLRFIVMQISILINIFYTRVRLLLLLQITKIFGNAR